MSCKLALPSQIKYVNKLVITKYYLWYCSFTVELVQGHWTLLVIFNIFLLGVSQHMHKLPNLWKFELNIIGRQSCEIIFQMLDFENSISNSEVSKSKFAENSVFLESYIIQREPFLTMFYTINLSPLLATK